MRDTDFSWVRELVRTKAAIVLDDRKRYLVESRLTPVARAHGFGGIAELVLAIRSGRRRDLVEEVVDAMTTNETSFFRDGVPWQAMREHVLPDIIARRRTRRRLRVWSAACSTGQEPYTLSMLLREHFPQVLDWNLEILATDISPSVLGKAQAGEYMRTEIGRGLLPGLRERYFDESENKRWIIKDEVRKPVRFERLNLAAPWPSWVGTFDIIFVRNVLIYFDVPTKKDILSRMEKRLAPDGYLLLGSGETTLNLDLGLRRRQADRAWFYQHG